MVNNNNNNNNSSAAISAPSSPGAGGVCSVGDIMMAATVANNNHLQNSSDSNHNGGSTTPSGVSGSNVVSNLDHHSLLHPSLNFPFLPMMSPQQEIQFANMLYCQSKYVPGFRVCRY